MPTAYFDIDDTVWPLLDWVIAEVKTVFGKDVDPEEVSWWAYWPDTLGKTWWDAFVGPLSVERIAERKLFEGAREAIVWMKENGFRIHFISHNPKGRELEPHIKAWLAKELGFDDFKLTIFGARNDKIAIMQADWDAWCIFEDKAETMRKAVKAGYTVFCKDRAVNRKVQQECPDIVVFTDWNEVPSLVNERLAKEVLDSFLALGQPFPKIESVV